MKIAGITLALLLIAVPSRAQNQPVARDYYEELYKAGRLDRLADLYVCFVNGKDTGTFFIFGESAQIRDRLKKMRKFNGLPKQDQDLLSQHVMVLRFYQKDIPSDERVLMTREGEAWTSEVRDLDDKGDKTRSIFSVNWRTLHIAYIWETILAPRSSSGNLHTGVKELPLDPGHVVSFGVCEQIPSRIQQHGPQN